MLPLIARIVGISLEFMGSFTECFSAASTIKV